MNLKHPADRTRWCYKVAENFELDPSATSVLVNLAHHWNFERKVAFPSQKTIRKEARLNVGTIRKAIERLQAREIIRVSKPSRKRNGRGRLADEYHINFSLRVSQCHLEKDAKHLGTTHVNQVNKTTCSSVNNLTDHVLVTNTQQVVEQIDKQIDKQIGEQKDKHAAKPLQNKQAGIDNSYLLKRKEQGRAEVLRIAEEIRAPREAVLRDLGIMGLSSMLSRLITIQAKIGDLGFNDCNYEHAMTALPDAQLDH